MNIPTPQKKGFTVYTRFGCAYCTYAKQILKNETVTIIDCDDYLSSEGNAVFFEKMQTVMGKPHKTFPIIFHKGIFIGGFTETKQYMEPIPKPTPTKKIK